MSLEWLLQDYMIWTQAVVGLFLLGGLLLGGLGYIRRRTLRVYNWDGRRYRFLGRLRIQKKNDAYVIKITERIWDLSYTTRYWLAPSEQFVRRHRNADLLLKAGRETAWLSVEYGMRQDIFWRQPGAGENGDSHLRKILV
ncbi:MAG: hypothetical protein LUI12_12005 [Clostridiales bacterium]|nr:hypothetical protein [Clostridiales bacterium]